MVAAATKAPRFEYAVTQFARDNAQRFEAATIGSDVVGGYKAERLGPDHWAIRNVDIFKATTRPNPATGKADVFDESWLQQAVTKFQERKSGRYLPPVHIEHHGKGNTPPFAGHLDNLRVEPGEDGVPTLYADIVDIPAAVFKEIASRRIPFRSIEVNKPNVPEVSSLALLTSTVPYHKLPLLRVDLPEGATFGADRRDAVYFATDIKHQVTITQPFTRGTATLDEPTAYAQRFMGQRYAGEGNRDESEDGDEYADPLEGLTEEDLAELEALEAADGGGEMDEEEEAAYGDEYGGEMDPDDIAELQELGLQEDDMGQALDQIVGALQQVAQGQKAVLEAVQANGATGKSQPPTPVPFEEKPTDDVKPNADGSVTISESQWAGLKSWIESANRKFAEYDEAFASMQAQEEREAIHAVAEQCFSEEVEKFEKSAGRRLTDREYQHASDTVLNAVNRRLESMTDQQFADDNQLGKAIKSTVETSFAHFSELIATSGTTPPRATNGPDPELPDGVSPVGKDEVAKFAESSTISGVKAVFAENPATVMSDFAQITNAWEGLTEAERKSWKTKQRFADYVFSQDDTYKKGA